ncbi:hypothetical protein FVE85_2798 [Porphyridium purpureum]|uniref:Uncharacterized protein n=1 Tax=Porphyridium purpureum TaxID=35688 RepID=A0A5J4YVX5_PORPP|nr:hypothetical protein FVE85_2798 [Porphyridium purpureum]|eukprot:POR2636..scf227_4
MHSAHFEIKFHVLDRMPEDSLTLSRPRVYVPSLETIVEEDEDIEDTTSSAAQADEGCKHHISLSSETDSQRSLCSQTSAAS